METEFAGSHVGMAGVGVSTDESCLDRLKGGFADVEKTSAFGSEQPLVPARGVGVAAHAGDIDGHHPGGLSAVDEVPEIVLGRGFADLPHRQHLSGCRGHVRDADHPSSRVYQALDAIDVLLRRSGGGLEHPDPDAVPLLPRQPRDGVADMLVRRGDDFVARLERQAVADDVDALGGVASIGDLLWTAAQDATSFLLDGRPELGRVAGFRGLLELVDAVVNCLYRYSRRRSEAAVVDINYLSCEWELVSDPSPEDLAFRVATCTTTRGGENLCSCIGR